MYIFRNRLSERTIKSQLGGTRSITRKDSKSINENLPSSKPISSASVQIQTEGKQNPHFLPSKQIGYRDSGDTIDLSKIGGDSSFEIAVDDTKPSRLRVTPEELLKNSIDRFDAFGDYEYIGMF